jgi:hypothetical protein
MVHCLLLALQCPSNILDWDIIYFPYTIQSICSVCVTAFHSVDTAQSTPFPDFRMSLLWDLSHPVVESQPNSSIVCRDNALAAPAYLQGLC